MNVFLCDDQAEFMENFANDLNLYFHSKNIPFRLFLFTRGLDLLLSNVKPDLIFLDIKMGEESGLSIAQKIRETDSQSKIIFLTAYKQYVFQAFDVDAAHYLIKPVSQKKLDSVLNHVIGQLSSIKEPPLILTTGRRTICLPCSFLMYLEVNNKTVTLHTQSGLEEFSGKLEIIEKKLPMQFFRCHRSYIVNMDFVSRLDKLDLYLSDGTSIPVSKRRYQDFSRAFLKHIQKEGLL